MTIPITDTALDMEKKAMERCTQRSAFRNWLAWVYFCMFITSCGLFYLTWFTNGLHNYMLTYMPLRNGTETFEFWERPPISLTYKIYVFNYTNVNDYERYRTDKLRVEEVGPFIYSETLKRVNVKTHENGTLTYQDKKTYRWIGGRSDNETVTVPNVLMVSSVAFVRDLSFAAQFSLTALLSSLQEKPFIQKTAEGFFWGYDNRFFDMLKPILMLQQKVPFEKFGMLAKNNGVSKDRITINSGIRDIQKLGLIERINGQESRNVWGDEECNKIGGTEGSKFPPHALQDTKQPLNLYFKDMCRSVPFDFSDEVEVEGLPALRYKFSMNAFNFSGDQNECYCQKVSGSKICPPSGVFNISACVDNTPIIMSFPHFYAADESLRNEIDGLQPRKEDHETYIDIYKNFAIPLTVRSRLQINVEVRKATAVPYFHRFRDGMILPLLWLEIANEDLTGTEAINILYYIHFVSTTMVTVIQWSSIVTMLFSICALTLCLKKRRFKEHTDVQLDTLNQDKLYVLS